MPVIGESVCQPIGDCGAESDGSYGPNAENASLFVDGSQLASQQDADGSRDKPYATIAEALAAASAGQTIAVAAGDYNEDLVIDRDVVIVGRCAQLVVIRGQSASFAVDVAKDTDITLRGLTITGPRGGIRVEHARALVDQVVVQGCLEVGLTARAVAEVALRRCLVSGNASNGLLLVGAVATVEHSVVRETRLRAVDHALGVGIEAISDADQPATLVIRDTVFDANEGAAIRLWSSTALIERTVVTNTNPLETGTSDGPGISAIGDPERSVVDIRDSVVANNMTAGISLYDSTATVERTVVRSTRPRASDKILGVGIAAYNSRPGRESQLTVRDSVVANNVVSGIYFFDSAVTLERTVVKDTESQASDGVEGIGVAGAAVYGDATLQMRDCLISGNRHAGVRIVGGNATLERSLISNTRGQAGDDRRGDGLLAVDIYSKSPSLTVTDCTIDSSQHVGLSVLGATTSIERTIVRDTRPQASDHQFGVGIHSSLIERGVSTLRITDSAIEDNRATGVLIGLSAATIERTTIRNTRQEEASSDYGDGVRIDTHSIDITGVIAEDLDFETTLVMSDSVVDSSARIGLGFWRSGGRVERSVFRGGVFSINLEEQADPIIGENNLFEDNTENSVTFGQGLKPSPPPPLPTVPRI